MNEDKILKAVASIQEGVKGLQGDVRSLQGNFVSLQDSVNGLIHSVAGIQQELKSFKQENRDEHALMQEGIEELKASANATDKLLEKHPIERIVRIESHLNLPTFQALTTED